MLPLLYACLYILPSPHDTGFTTGKSICPIGTGQRSIICVARNNHACKNGPGTTRLVKMIQERAKNGPRTGQEQPRLQEWARNNQACENDPGTGQERAKNRPGTAQISTRARMHERFICRTRPQDKAYPRDKKLKWFCVSTEYHYPVASIQLKIYTNSMNIPDRLLSPAKSRQE